MKSRIPLLFLAACAGRSIHGGLATEPAPIAGGVEDLDSTTFEGEASMPDSGDFAMVSEADGTVYNLLGQAVEGPGAQERTQLGMAPGMTAFWFAWSVHHPGAQLWPEGVVNPGEEILASEECGVPCEELITGCSGGTDCIPSIDEPVWTTPSDSAQLGYLSGSDRVLGLYLPDGTARAYPLDALWTHEVVNDELQAGKMTVSYCPLTGSGIALDAVQGGVEMEFGVSGLLYNSNLVLYDRTTDSLYGQMRQVGVHGQNHGLELATQGVIDTTWDRWLDLVPHTLVLSEDVGVSPYPYGDYREDHEDTFILTNPAPDPSYPGKSYAIGLLAGGETKIWPFEALREEIGSRGVLNDELGGVPVVLAFDLSDDTAVIYGREVEGEAQRFALRDEG